MKSKKPKKSILEQMEDLSKELLKRPLPEDVLNDELWDACQSGARLEHESIREAVLLDKIDFLYHRGCSLERIKEMVNEDMVQRGRDNG